MEHKKKQNTMARSMMAGMTDYSHQSFVDLKGDLIYWRELSLERAEWIEENISKLESIDYWKKVPYDFQSEIYYSKKFFTTVVSEIDLITKDIESEVQDNHVRRLISLAETAQKENRDIGQTWHGDYESGWKEYRNENFMVVEELYGRTRDLVASLSDLANIASRLVDFKGKMKKEDSKSILNSAQFGDNVTVNIGDNNTVTTTNVKVTEGNFDELRKTLEHHKMSNGDIDELEQILEEDIPDSENKSFGRNVSEWMGRMITKAAQNIWNIGVGVAGSLLAQALNLYYGWM